MSDTVGQSVGDPLLRVPPFPGARISCDAMAVRRAPSPAAPSRAEVGDLLDRMRATRVGGSWWAAQPDLPSHDYLLLRPGSRGHSEAMLREARHQERPVLLWPDDARTAADDVPTVTGECDPWHLLKGAVALWTHGDDETAFIAALMGVPVRQFGDGGRFTALNGGDADALNDTAARELLTGWAWRDPFTGAPCGAADIIRHCAEWRRLVDANRRIAAAYGFGQWKRGTVDALLWNGAGDHAPFAPARADHLATLAPEADVAVWKARVPADFLAACESRSGTLHEVEDGFIRSVGLGADCVPPLSIIVDPRGVHYDPSRPSTLEALLAEGSLSSDLVARAAQLRELIVTSGVSKYEVGGAALARPGGTRRHILVTGQVEDDRSVLAGAGEVRGNLDLLRRARAAEPDAYILYKPHPDVLSGHRKGHVAEADALGHADAVVTGQSMPALLDMVDGVHVMTSLAGFEALLRGKDVTAHGVPFYAGWGLTRDLGPVPARRGRARSLDELIAAALLLYPRYLDPATGLPCPPEVLVERLAAGVRRRNPALVMLRRTQGGLRRIISGMGFAA